MVHSRNYNRKGKHMSLSVVDSNYNDLTFWYREKLPAGPSGAHQDLLEELHANCSSPTKSKSPTSAFLAVIFSAAAVCLSNSWAPENRSWLWRTKKVPLSQFNQLSAFLKVPNLVSCLNRETPSWAELRVQL